MLPASDVEILAKTIYGEARGEPLDGQIAVAWVVMNRVEKMNRWASSIRGVVLQRKQFSCWNSSDENLGRIAKVDMRDERYARAVAVAILVLNGDYNLDPTHGATHYINPDVCDPAWQRDMVVTTTIGRHRFMKEKPDA